MPACDSLWCEHESNVILKGNPHDGQAGGIIEKVSPAVQASQTLP